MSALWREANRAPRDACVLQPMTSAQLDTVLAIEARAYEFPWSRANFIDSLAAGHAACVLYDPSSQMLGYFVAMPGVDEMHLLNITVAPDAQRLGHARFMLGELLALCRQQRLRKLWLEVRESNSRARAIYQRLGFAHVGMRKGYYPAAQGRREDAVVMSLDVGSAEAAHALE